MCSLQLHAIQLVGPQGSQADCLVSYLLSANQLSILAKAILDKEINILSILQS